MSKIRVVGWFSCGAASAVAFKLALERYPDAIPVYCVTGAEHEDNIRFAADCEKWFGKKIHRLNSRKYRDTWDVWTQRRYLAGIRGAPCSVELKIVPRLAFQEPSDIHVFGYTADAADVARAKRFRTNFPEVHLKTPLIDNDFTKARCISALLDANITPPKMYELGFSNNNCIPCVKATSPAYWALIRSQFPDQFARMASLSRKLGVRLCRLNDMRAFIDEIPKGYPTVQRNAVSCDFLCGGADIASAARKSSRARG